MTISEICGLPLHGRIPHGVPCESPRKWGSRGSLEQTWGKKAGLNFTHFQRGWFSGEIEDTMWFLYVLVCSSVVLFLSLSLCFYMSFYHPKIWGSRGAHGLASWYVSRIEIKAGKYMSHGQTWSNHVLFWDIALLFWEIQTIYIYIYNQYLCLDHSTYDNPRNQTVNLIAGPSSRGQCCQLQFWGALAQRASGKLRPQVVTLKSLNMAAGWAKCSGGCRSYSRSKVSH